MVVGYLVQLYPHMLCGRMSSVSVLAINTSEKWHPECWASCVNSNTTDTLEFRFLFSNIARSKGRNSGYEVGTHGGGGEI